MDKKKLKDLLLIIGGAIFFAVIWIITEFIAMPWYANLILFIAVFLFLGYKVLWKAIRNISNGQIFDENFLMCIASIGAICIGDYPEAVAVMLFYRIGEFCEDFAVGKARKSIAALMDIAPLKANVYRNGEWQEVAPEEVEVGEKMLVKVGDKVAVDCILDKGEALLDVKALNGESLPKSVEIHNEILSGSINIGSAIEVTATKVYQDSTVAKILELVENSSQVKSKSEQFITKFARYYTPAVVILAILLAVIPPLFNGQWSEYVNRALMFLVVSCPCALIISVPLSFFAAIGAAGKIGVLIKGGNFVETLSRANIFAMDKTGTITTGDFSVVKIHQNEGDGVSKLGIMASLEQYSSHPIARAITASYDGNLLPCEVREIAGRGLIGKIDGKTYYLGNYSMLKESFDNIPQFDDIGTVTYLADDTGFLAAVVVRDTLKEDSEAAIKELRAGGSRLVMLTGDNSRIANNVAEELGIEVRSELLPQDKVKEVEKLLAEKNDKDVVAFVGDGINDAPSLVRADLGIAMGGVGSEVAIEAADIVLMHDTLSSLVKAKGLAKKNIVIVKQNIIFALAIKLVILILSGLGLTNMWLAVFADVGVSVLAILNAMRCLRVK